MMRLAVRLATLRLWRSRFPFMCQSLAVMAVMVPILIILGLKSGIISGMREELLSNPSSLEISMTDSVDLTNETCASIRQWPETGFIIPRTSLLSSTVSVASAADKDRKERMDLLPSAEGDPVMYRGGVPAPADGEVVLSSRAATALNLKAGDSVCVTAWRNAKQEKFEETCKLVGVLPETVERRSIIYMPLKAALRVEEFIVNGREGANTPALVTGPAYEAIVVHGDDAEMTARLLQENNGLLTAQRGGEGRYKDLPTDCWVAGGNGSRITPDAANWLIELANRRHMEARAWNPPMQAVLRQAADAPITIRCSATQNGSCGTCKVPPTLTVHKAGQPMGTLLVASKGGTSEIVCALQEDASVPEGEAIAGPQLMAMLHSASQNCIVWDYRESSPRRPTLSYVSMRLYASGLEQAEPLYKRMLAHGYPCRAKLGVIRQLLSLERALDILFLIVSGCAALGAALSMAMGLFNATERSLKDYAQLQIMGIPRMAQGLFPLVEAVGVALFSFVCSLVIFLATASLLGMLFESGTHGHGICSLSIQQAASFLGVSLGLALLAAVASSIRIFFIDPSKTIRQ